MSVDPLVCSFDVDKYSSHCACPGCTGQQPKVLMPPFYPDSASVFLSREEAQNLFSKMNKIFKNTGMGMGAVCCTIWIQILLTIIVLTLVFLPPTYFNENIENDSSFYEGFLQRLQNPNTFWESPVIIGACVLGGITALAPFLCLCCLWCRQGIRKSNLTSELENWNRKVGLPRGIYFALGGEDGRTGASAEDFWLGIYPRRIQTRAGRHVIIDNKNPKVHLYVNPTARREFCNQTGLEFYLPPQYIQVQVPGTVAYNMNISQTGQPIMHGGYEQPPVQGALFVGRNGQPVFKGGYGEHSDQGGYVMTNF